MRFWKRSPPPPPPAPCPDCGKPLSLRNRFCRACGWDADHGTEASYLDGVDLPEGYGGSDEATVERSPGRKAFWWCVAVLCLYLALRMVVPW